MELVHLMFSEEISGPHEMLLRYYNRQEVFSRLIPPWSDITVLGSNISCTEKCLFHLRLQWSFLHVNITLNYHTSFHKLSEQKTEIIESLDYELPFSKIWMKDLIEKKLRELWRYRYRILQEDFKHYALYADKKTMRILLVGASGFIGRHLEKVLKAFGHNVFKLVRKAPATPKEIYWDPKKADILPADFEGFDAVIHLGGENVTSFWWTQAKKQRIYDSRVLSTQVLAQTLNQLQTPPKVFICASACGFYGSCGNQEVDETFSEGQGFLAKTAHDWERSAHLFTKGRVASMRFGVVIGIDGGVCKKLFPLCSLGFGSVIGSGNEWISWIYVDDAIYQILHTIMQESLQGPINCVAPHPLRSYDFYASIAYALHRPLWIRIPAWMMRCLGEMGQELFLNSIRAIPKKLIDSHALFAYPTLMEAFNHCLRK